MECTFKNARLNYSVCGTEGLALLLLHGFLENQSMWQPLMAALPAEQCVITMDLPGHGKSECLGYIHSMQDMAEAVKAVLYQEDIEEVQLVGHSMGGYVGLAFAKANQKQVKRIALLNSTPLADTEERKEIRLRATEAAQQAYPALVSMSVANLFAPKNHQKLKTQINTVKEEALKTPVQGYIAAQLGMMQREDHSDFWKTATQSRCLILGQEDSLIDWKAHRALFKAYAPVVAIDSGHMSLIEKEEETILQLLKFLKIE
ncbi:alpha/beta fold hydrolase [Croceiramulus getboli]|nr:alpha/beta hydrolase [Flavobacteriaceae bacterium YJPT1-3]